MIERSRKKRMIETGASYGTSGETIGGPFMPSAYRHKTYPNSVAASVVKTALL